MTSRIWSMWVHSAIVDDSSDPDARELGGHRDRPPGGRARRQQQRRVIGRHERHPAAGVALVGRVDGVGRRALTTVRSTRFISNIEKLAPRQRRVPPPNGIHV